jgi:hypothetical protein
MLPEAAHGRSVLVLVPVYTGEPATSAEVIAPLAALGQPLADLVTKMPWLQANRMLDAVAPYGKRMNLRGGYLPALSPEAVDALSAIVEKETGLTAYDPQTERPLAEMQPEGAIGLMSRITEDLRSRYGG